MQKQILCWKNRFSGEQGYVKSVSRKKGYFENTFDAKEAKSYMAQSVADKDLEFMEEIGETANNEFFFAKA